MCAEMNMIWLHVEASNLKLSGWVWSPCSQERTEKSYHASSLFRLAPPSPHLLITYYKSTHCSGLPFPEARAIYLLSLFSGSLGCDPGRLSYLLLDAPWSPHQSPFGSQAAKKKKKHPGILFLCQALIVPASFFQAIGSSFTLQPLEAT